LLARGTSMVEAAVALSRDFGVRQMARRRFTIEGVEEPIEVGDPCRGCSHRIRHTARSRMIREGKQDRRRLLRRDAR
jgi:hypothetical protein